MQITISTHMQMQLIYICTSGKKKKKKEHTACSPGCKGRQTLLPVLLTHGDTTSTLYLLVFL